MQNISLYIPHVFANFTKEYIVSTFERLDIGLVNHVDLVGKMGTDGKPYNSAYIHFTEWHDNAGARNLQERVLNPEKQARLMYDDPWFWIVLENKAQKFNSGDRKKRISLETPVKSEPKLVDLTKAPVKGKSYSQVTDIKPLSLQEAFEAAGINNTNENTNESAFETEMDELEELMEKEGDYLITIDGRYVEELEKELLEARRALMTLQAFSLKYHI
jgi:hypothetical protein